VSDVEILCSWCGQRPAIGEDHWHQAPTCAVCATIVSTHPFPYDSRSSIDPLGPKHPSDSWTTWYREVQRRRRRRDQEAEVGNFVVEGGFARDRLGNH
jgi:hypothetical protein